MYLPSITTRPTMASTVSFILISLLLIFSMPVTCTTTTTTTATTTTTNSTNTDPTGANLLNLTSSIVSKSTAKVNNIKRSDLHTYVSQVTNNLTRSVKVNLQDMKQKLAVVNRTKERPHINLTEFHQPDTSEAHKVIPMTIRSYHFDNRVVPTPPLLSSFQFSPTDDRTRTNAILTLLQQVNNTLLSNPHTTQPFMLYRTVGNDLPPRHQLGQSYSNLKFILENEPNLPFVDKRWYVNRIINSTQLFNVLQLLVEHKQYFVVDPFNFDHFLSHVDYDILNNHDHDVEHMKIINKQIFLNPKKKNITTGDGDEFNAIRNRLLIDKIMKSKNQYIIHNNQVRNTILKLSTDSGAEYILPFDGNCFISQSSWHEIITSIHNLTNTIPDENQFQTSLRYFIVPMMRTLNNSQILSYSNSNSTLSPFHNNSFNEEPQIIFHRSANEKFDEHLSYGCRPKVDLLWRLRIPGWWTNFSSHNNPCIQLNASRLSADVPAFNSVKKVGWTFRLYSGHKELEHSSSGFSLRGASRTDAVENIVAYAHHIAVQRRFKFSGAETTLFYNLSKLNNNELIYKQNSIVRYINDQKEYYYHGVGAGKNQNIHGDDGSSNGGNMLEQHQRLSLFKLIESLFMVVSDKYKCYTNVKYGLDCNENNQSAHHDVVTQSSRDSMLFALGSTFSRSSREINQYSKMSNSLIDKAITHANEHHCHIQQQLKLQIERERAQQEDAPPPEDEEQEQEQEKEEEEEEYNPVQGIQLCYALDAARLLETKNLLGVNTKQKLRNWVTQRLQWIHESDGGRRAYARNDIEGVAWEVSTACLAAYVEDMMILLRRTALARPRALDWNKANGMISWGLLATIGEKIGVDVWKTIDKYQIGLNESNDGVMQIIRQLKVRNLHDHPIQSEATTNSIKQKVIWDAPAMHDETDIWPPFWNLAYAP